MLDLLEKLFVVSPIVRETKLQIFYKVSSWLARTNTKKHDCEYSVGENEKLAAAFWSPEMIG
jgi:hypothetical protein